jgi:pilus assembly protein Flp/PilA
LTLDPSHGSFIASYRCTPRQNPEILLFPKGGIVIQRLVRDDHGQDLIEYVLLGSFIAIAAILGVTALGTNLNTWYSAIASWASKQSAKVP